MGASGEPPSEAALSDASFGSLSEPFTLPSAAGRPAPASAGHSLFSREAPPYNEPNSTAPDLPHHLSADRGPIVHVRSPSCQTPNYLPLGLGLAHGSDAPFFGSSASLHHTTRAPSDELLASAAIPLTSLPIPMDRPVVRSGLSASGAASHYSVSPASVISSPALAAMTDITPLPSPLMPEDSPGPWRRSLIARPGSSGSLGSVKEEVLDYLSTPTRSSSGTRKKKTYPNLVSAAVESSSSANAQFRKNVSAHARNRSLSEFASEALHNVRPRNTTIVGPYDPQLEATRPGVHMQREAYLAEQRGFVQPAASAGAGLPTPPPSNRSVNESEEEEVRDEESHPGSLTVRVGPDMRKRRYRPVRRLGQGTFSKVVLATSQSIPPNAVLDEGSEAWLDPKYLVAIKIVEHGPAGGADEERVELGLKREVEVLRSISHPSLIHLKAFDCNETEALLVLNYCPGGDLFDLTSAHHDFLQQKVVQRIFSELVGAVRYLHSKWIVHRDIKLENTLLNVPVSALPTIADPLTYPHPLVTLTDLGLSRKIPEPPASPLLTTRCGSEDYAAPEIMLSQPYDGRQTDAWALGVLLYALMEGRLPFDAPPPRPGAKPIRGRSRTGHRIARCEWIWCRFGDDDGDWDATRGAGWEEARECVEGLLRKVSRGRYSLDELAEKKWVKEGIQTEGGLVREPHADEDMDG